MGADANMVMKKLLQKVADSLVSHRKYKGIDKVEVYFVFGSQYKTAMCQFVYGLKIKTNLPYSRKLEFIRELQGDIKSFSEKKFNTTICNTDVVYEN